MNVQCSPEPYRLTADGRLEKSGLYHQMKSFKTKPIEDIITSLMEKGVLPTIKDYNNIRGYAEDNADVSLENAFKRRILTAFLYAEADARTPYGATGYPVYTSGELKLESVLAALSTDETYSEDIRKDFESLGNALGLDIKHAFNPSIVNTATFNEMDYAYMARVLTAAYFKLKGLTAEQRQARFGANYRDVSRSGFKALILAEFNKELEEYKARPNFIPTRFNDIFVANVLTDLNKGNSQIFNYFLDYIDKNYGINRKRAYQNNQIVDDESTEEGQRDAIEDIEVMWDDLQKERIDRKNTLSSHVKAQIALLVGSSNFKNRTANKAYIPAPIDINVLWNKLIEAHLYDIQPQDVYNRLQQLAAINDEFTPILEIFQRVFEDDGSAASDYDNSFVNAYISGIKLAVIPVNIMALEGGNNATIYQNNRESFGVKTYIDRFESILSTNIEFGLYNNLNDVLYTNPKSKRIFEPISRRSKIDKAALLDKQMSVINYLGLAITRDALTQYYNANDNVNEVYSRVNSLLENVVNDTKHRVNTYRGKEIPAHNINGYLYSLAQIATYDFNSFTNMSYLDVQGKLNYSPQYDSMLTKFLRGFVTRTGVNTEYIKHIFKDYLNDPTLTAPGAEDNILIYDEKTGLGIFTKNSIGEYEVNPAFISDVERRYQFALSAFNGVKIGNKGLKYREVQGALYTYTEVILNMLGQYVFLTSDSPRSYMMTTKRLEVDDLFIKDSSKPRTSIHVKTFGSNYTSAAVASHPKSVFIFSGNTKSRAIGAPATSGQESIRGLKNTIEIDGFKGENITPNKPTTTDYFTDADYDAYVKDFESRVVPFINDAISRGLNIYLPMNGISSRLATHAPRIYSYVTEYLDNLVARNKFVRITDNPINEESNVFHSIEKIVNSDIFKFNTFGQIIFQLRDNSDENLAQMKTRHNRKYWNGGAIYDAKGIPTGKAFQFLNITYIENGKNITLPAHIAKINNVDVTEVYRNMIAQVRNEPYDENLVANTGNIRDFVTAYIRWNATTGVDSFENIAKSIYDTNIKTDTSVVTTFDSYLADLVQEVYNQKANDWIKRRKADGKEYTLDTIPALKKESLLNSARQHVLATYDIMDNDGVRLSLLKVLLNHTIYNHSMNAIFNGDIEEYKDTVDLNKRVAQVIKNGLNSIDSIHNDTPRKVVVMEDMNFNSNILDKMGIQNEAILDAYRATATINDSQSIMTDIGLIKLLKATGRWNPSEPLYQYITDLQDPTKTFNPTSYAKVVEQVKLFGTTRRRRGDFYHAPAVTGNEVDIFADEVDSVQIKDSTVVLFESMTRGSAIGQLYDWMIQNNIDQVSPISAVKVSGITPVKIHNDQGGLDIEALNRVDDRSILYMRDSDFVIQQDIKADLLDETTILGGQLVKQIMEGLDWNNAIYELDGKNVTGKELFDEFQKTLATNIREDAMQLLYDIGGIDENGEIRTDARGAIQIDINKLVNRFQEIISDDVDAITIRKALEIKEDGLPIMPLSYPVIKGKLEKILASMLSKQVINKYLPGFHAPIRADIFTASNELIKHNEFYSDKELYNKTIDELVANGSITYASSFIEECKRTGRSLELQAEYREDGNYHYAEVIVNPWKMDFYKNIGTVKTITNEDGTTKDIITVDIDKLDVEARRMIGIRIPTEGKQSMVVFEVVGFLNNNATQAIFPQSLITRTGWDFDIDSIYAYYRNVIFEQDKYIPVEFKSKFDASQAQVGGKFTRSIFKQKYIELATTPQEFTNLTSHNFNAIVKWISRYYNPNLVPTNANQSPLNNIIELIKEDLQDVKSNPEYTKILKSILHNLQYGFAKNYGDVNSLVREYLANKRDGVTEDFGNYTQTQRAYTSDLLIRAHKAINDLIKFVKNINSQLATIDISPDTISNFDTIKSKFQYIVEDTDKTIVPHLSAIQSNIDKAFNAFTKDFVQNESIYELNSREARDNHLIDIITAVLSNPNHAEEVNKPNGMAEIQAVSDRDNALWNYTLKTLNPNNLMDKITLNNMSMGSTVLKGHSVNFDTLIATISTLHGRLLKGIRRKISLNSLPIPKGFADRSEMYTVSDKGVPRLTSKYKEFLAKRYGAENIQLLPKENALWVNDVWINNDALNEHLDISGERVELQMNQFTSGILDVLKAGLGFNLNVHTLSVARAISSGVTIELYNDKPNRFTNEDAFIHQPAIIEAVNRMEVQSLSRGNFTILDAIEAIRSDYSVELAKIYADLIVNKEITPVESHDVIMTVASGKSKTKTLTVGQLNELKDKLPNITINEISGKYGYQTTEELLDNIKNRDNRTADWLLRQISVLGNFVEYNEIATNLIDLNFMLKSESRVDSFFKADQKERKLAEYYYPVKALKELVNDKYNQTLRFIDEYIEENAGNPKAIDAIKAAFTRESSDAFRRHYKPKDVKGNPLAAITYLDMKRFRAELPKRNDIMTRRELIEDLAVGYETPNKVILDNGKDIIESIFVGSFEGYLDGNKFNDTENQSAYGIIQARYQYAHWLMANGFGDVFITRNHHIANTILGQILQRKNSIDESTYKYVTDSIMNYLVSINGGLDNGLVKVLPILTPDNTPEILTTLGIHTEEQLKEQKLIFKTLLNTVKDGYTPESFTQYTKLSLAQQIQFIQKDSTLRDYIEKSPEFRGDNIFKYLTIRKNNRSVPYDVIRIQRDDNDVNSWSNMTDSILRMWDSKIPYIAHTIRQLLVYTYVTEGFNYAYNVSKYIPIELISTNRPNAEYDALCREVHYPDPSVNIGNYAENLRNAEKAVFDGNVDITPVMSLISRMKSDMNPVLLSDIQKRYRWEANKNKATIGYVQNANGENVGTGSYIDENGNTQNFYIETEARLINSEYANAEYVTERITRSKNRVYKRYAIPTNTNSLLKQIYVFLPVNPLLRNEASLMTGDISIIPTYQEGMMAQVQKDGETIITDRLSVIIDSDAIHKFMLAIDDNESVQMDENSDFNDANMIETEDTVDSTIDVETEDVIDTDVASVSDTDFEVLNSIEVTTPTFINVEHTHSSASDVIYNELESSASSIFITTQATHSFYKGYHKSAIQVDYNKSAYEEALRVAPMLKNGNLYINGDVLIDANRDFNYLDDWTKTFISNLYRINPIMTSISTVLNDGVGRIVAETYIDVPRRNINIYGDNEKLYSRVIHADVPTRDGLRNSLVVDSNIAIETLKIMDRIQKFLNNNNVGNREEFMNILKSFDDESFEGGIQSALEERDIAAMKATYSRLANLSSSVYDAIKQLWAITKDLNYEEIRSNYGAALDYKDRLVMMLKLASHFSPYLTLEEIKIQDTVYDAESEEGKELFTKEFGELNNNIARLKSLATKVVGIRSNVIQSVKDVVTWAVIDKSRNPKYTTTFSKIKEYLASHNGSLEGFDVNSVEITEDEWLEIQHLLFELDKDINKTQLWLDSAFTTGITLIDITGKAWDEANYKAKKAAQRINDELESALEEFQPGLSKNARAREKLMHKFINEYGDLIGSYKTEGLGDSTGTLRKDIRDAIYKNLYTDSGFVTRATAEKTLEIIDDIIKKYNENHTWNIVSLSDVEAAKHLAELTELSNREKLVYLQTHDLIELSLITDISGKRENVLYKLDFGNTPVSDEYAALSDKEQKLLNTIRNLIQRTIREYDGNWINYYGRWDEVMPFIPQATLGQSAKQFVSIPMIHKDRYYTDIDGTKRFVTKAQTLQVPKHIPVFNIRKKYKSESYTEYEARIVELFSEWFDKNNKLPVTVKPSTLREIRHYNDSVMLENKKYKANVMSYDIVDVMKGFTQELYNLRAINNFETDYQLTKYLMNERGVSGVAPRDIIKNANEQLNNMERRIFNFSKYNSALDVSAGALLRYTSMTFMYLNYTAGITNILKGVTDMIVESTANNFVESKDIMKSGLRDVIKTIPHFLRDINSTRTDDILVAIIKDFDDIYQDTRDVTSSDTGTSYWIKAMRMVDTVGYAPNNMGEFIMQFGMLLAATQSHRVVGGKIMAFNDFYNDNLEKLLQDVLTNEQYDKYLIFKEDLDAEIAREEKRTSKEYLWNHDYASQYLKSHYNLLSDEQRKKIVDSRKTDKKVQREAFDKYNTLRSELKLEDGRLSFNPESGLTEETLSEFRGRVKAINQSLHGIYNRVDRNSLQDAAFGDLLMQFKKWVRPNFVRYFGRRFGRIFYNEQLGSYEVPVFNPMFDMFRSGSQAFKDSLNDNNTVIDYMKGIGNFFKGVSSWLLNVGFYYNTLPLNEQIATMKFARLMGALVFSALAAMTLGAFKKDDDDEDNILYQHAMYAATTYYQQMIEPMPVFGWMATIEQTANSLFAGQKTLQSAYKLVNLTIQGLWVDDDELIYDRGIYKGQDKRAVALRQAVPVLRQINKFNNLGATMSYYNMYNPFGITFTGFRDMISPKDNDNYEDE